MDAGKMSQWAPPGAAEYCCIRRKINCAKPAKSNDILCVEYSCLELCAPAGIHNAPFCAKRFPLAWIADREWLRR